jgi:hypothetical protein
VTHRGHLGHKGLARRRGRRNQQVAVVQKPVFAQRLLLQRQQALDPLPPPRLEGLGREAERGQMFDRKRHDDPSSGELSDSDPLKEISWKTEKVFLEPVSFMDRRIVTPRQG